MAVSISARGPKLLVVVVGGAALVIAVAMPGSAQEAAGLAATGGAEASGMTVRYGFPAFLVVENFIDGGGPVAQSVADTSAGAGSFASLPYPGETAVAAPGTAAGLGAPRLPDWPFYVSASHPTRPEQNLSDPGGGYQLIATAAEGKARSSAAAGSPPSFEQAKGRSTAHTEVTTNADGVVSLAESTVDGFTMGALSVASVVSKSVTTYRANDPEPATATDLRVEGGRVDQLGFHYGPDGLKVNNQAVALPAAEGLKALNQALAPSGLSLRISEPQPLKGGGRSAALEVVSLADVPGAGKGTLHLALGGSTSYISVGDALGLPAETPVDVPAGVDPNPPADAGGTSPAGLSPVPASPLPELSSGAVSSPAGPFSAPVGTAGSDLPAGEAVAAAVASPSASSQPLAFTPELLVSPKDFDSTSLLALGAAAAGLLMGGMLVVGRRIRKVTSWIG